MSREKKITFLSIALSLVLIMGVSFAFFYYQRVSTKNVTLIAGEIYLHLNDGTDSLTLTNVFPETVEEARARDDNVLTFTIDGKNTTTNKDIWYEIDLVEGDTETGRTRIDPQYIKFDLIELENGVETMVVNAKSFADLDSRKIHVNSVNRNTTTEIVRTYKLRAWFSDSILISDSDENATYSTSEWSNIFASIKVKAQGDFEEKSMLPTMAAMCPGCKFMYTTITNYTTWNNQSQTPTQITSGLYDDYQELIATTGKNYFLGVKLNNNSEVTNAYACGVNNGTPFCIEGTSDESKYTANQTLLQGANLYNNTCSLHPDSETGYGYDYVECGPWDNSGSVSARADSDGLVLAGVGIGDDCHVYPDGAFGCIESGAAEPGGK